MSEQKIKRLLDAGCENLYPKFIFGVGEERCVAAEVVGGELLVYAEGEALLAPPVTRAAPRKKAEAAPVAPSTNEAAEDAPEGEAAEDAESGT